MSETTPRAAVAVGVALIVWAVVGSGGDGDSGLTTLAAALGQLVHWVRESLDASSRAERLPRFRRS